MLYISAPGFCHPMHSGRALGTMWLPAGLAVGGHMGSHCAAHRWSTLPSLHDLFQWLIILLQTQDCGFFFFNGTPVNNALGRVSLRWAIV